MTQPTSGDWPDPSSGQPYAAPVDPTLPATPQPPSQPTGYDPYPSADPYGASKSDPGIPPAPYPPAGYPPAQPGYGYPQPGYGYPPPQPTNSMAIVALVLSLIGIASCITAPIGAIMGHVALRQIRERGESGEGMAKAAIIVGWILTGLLVLGIAAYVAIIVFAIASSSSTV